MQEASQTASLSTPASPFSTLFAAVLGHLGSGLESGPAERCGWPVASGRRRLASSSAGSSSDHSTALARLENVLL